MDLESILLSEVTQIGRKTLYILPDMWILASCHVYCVMCN